MQNEADNEHVGVLLGEEPVRDVGADIPDQVDTLEECAEHTPLRPSSVSSHIGRRIGAYLLLRRIGEGGMGTVYLAERADGCFEKHVAIKLMRAGPDAKDVVRRFCSEREVLARLDHPNIARLLDAGTTGDGLPYLIMEHVDGIPVTQFVQEKRLSLTARLELFLKITAAVEAAHNNSVIHRDLKPSNILVGRDGNPRLLDFGIAKLLGGEPDHCAQTVFGRERLTPFFASPEQAKGEGVTIASDVYSLGVVLYEMLTDARPFRLPTDYPRQASVLDAISNQSPTLPSRAVTRRAGRRQLRGDFDAILLRAMQKDPSARYSSVSEFAEDIRRHLDGRPVKARFAEKAYRIIRSLFRKSRLRFAVAAFGLLFACASIVLFHRFGMSSNARPLVSEGATSDLIAERLFVQAWQLVTTGSEPNAKDSQLRAVPLLDEAVTRDPHFVRAYALLAILHLNLYWQGFDHTIARRDKARLAIEKAAHLHPDDGEVHLARAAYAYHGFRNYDLARAELGIAQAKLPNNASVYSFLSAIDRRQGRWTDALRNHARSVELGPGTFGFTEEEAFTFEALRRYDDARRTYERALEIMPRNYFARAQLARISFRQRGDLSALRSEISAILKDEPNAAKEIANTLFECAFAERNAVELARSLDSISPEGLRDTYSNSLWSRDWFLGLAARALGDSDKERESFMAARAVEEKAVTEQPDDPHTWSRLGLIDAGLGHKETAIREGRHACELLPVSRDAWDGAQLIVNLAMIYAWTGEKDLAFEQLTTAARIPAGVSYGELALLPQWDSLRTDSRFKKILTLLAPE